MKTRMMVLSTLLISLLGAGCSDDKGRIEALVVDDPQTPMAPPAMSEQAAPADQSSPDGFSGSLNGELQVSISVDGSTWVDLGKPKAVNVSLQSTDGATVYGRVDAPIGIYNRVHLTFTNVEARLSAGSTWGGLTLTTQVAVVLGGSDHQVVVEKSVSPFEVRANSTSLIRFDMNAETWIGLEAVQSQAVADANVQQAVAASVVTS
jgi:hypothetical protein